MRYDFLIIGGGIFGLTAAVELAKRKHKVGLLEAGSIPNHLAASTDVTKAVRMEYGSDEEYFKMAEASIEGWRAWNDFFGVKLYHEVGFLMLCREPLESKRHQYERDSYQMLLKHGYEPEWLDVQAIRERYPVVNEGIYTDAVFNPIAGYVESANVVAKLADYARSLGVEIHEQQPVSELIIEAGRVNGVKTRGGRLYSCGHAIVAAGAHTHILLPELQTWMRATGHPVFWLKPQDPAPFMPPNFGVFTADISNTGWYGFPFLNETGIVKVAKHAQGIVLHPERDNRRVTDAEVVEMRSFVGDAFPGLRNAPLVYTRRCLYSDTRDGHFLIDKHSEVEGLTVAAGGSGHGLKMAPVLGRLIVESAVNASTDNSRFRWRELGLDTVQVEEARFIASRS